jgi:hypothetical protein
MWVYGVGTKVPVPTLIPVQFCGLPIPIPKMRVFTLPIMSIFCGYPLGIGKFPSLQGNHGEDLCQKSFSLVSRKI